MVKENSYFIICTSFYGKFRPMLPKWQWSYPIVKFWKLAPISPNSLNLQPFMKGMWNIKKMEKSRIRVYSVNCKIYLNVEYWMFAWEVDFLLKLYPFYRKWLPAIMWINETESMLWQWDCILGFFSLFFCDNPSKILQSFTLAFILAQLSHDFENGLKKL